MTAPLRRMLVKDTKFGWDDIKDQAFRQLLRMMNSDMYLAPFNPTKKTHIVTNASPKRIAALLYQEDNQSR